MFSDISAIFLLILNTAQVFLSGYYTHSAYMPLNRLLHTCLYLKLVLLEAMKGERLY